VLGPYTTTTLQPLPLIADARRAARASCCGLPNLGLSVLLQGLSRRILGSCGYGLHCLSRQDKFSTFESPVAATRQELASGPREKDRDNAGGGIPQECRADKSCKPAPVCNNLIIHGYGSIANGGRQAWEKNPGSECHKSNRKLKIALFGLLHCSWPVASLHSLQGHEIFFSSGPWSSMCALDDEVCVQRSSSLWPRRPSLHFIFA